MIRREEEGICFLFDVVFAEDSRPDVVLSKAEEEVRMNPKTSSAEINPICGSA